MTIPSNLKNWLFSSSLGVCFGAFLCPSTLNAAALYFRPGGITTAVAGSNYTWDTSTASWYTGSTAGTSGTWADNNTATLLGTGTGLSYSINLVQDVTVSGLATTGAMPATAGITIAATSARTITFGSGAIITDNFGANRPIIFGNNINLSGAVTVNSGAIRLAGASYGDTLTVSTSGTTSGFIGRLQIGNGDAANYLTTAKVLLAGGDLALNTSGTASIAQLSGTSGSVTRDSGGTNGTLVVNQSTNTTFSGTLVGSSYTFQKEGSGILVFDGTGAQTFTGAKKVNAGSFYVKSALAGTVAVAANANFGGTTTTSGLVTLSAASSRLSPGMFDVVANKQTAGTLILSAGLTATSGATFDFALNGDNGGSILNSEIVFSAGTFNLGVGTTKTIDFFDLGGGHIQAGVAYMLLDGTGATLSNGWNTGWTAGSVPSNWTVSAFTFDSTHAYVTFSAIPEPSTIGSLAFGLGAGALLIFRRRGSVR